MRYLVEFIGNEFLKTITKVAEPQSLGQCHAFDFSSEKITASES